MTIAAAEVVRHFLRLEAGRSKFANRKDELFSWCELSDSEVMAKARRFAEERDDVNPVLVFTVGARGDDHSSRVASWTRERIKCRDIFTSGISSRMRPDIDAVRGNMLAFALGPAMKYSEFRPLSPLCDISSIVILVAHRRQTRDGQYEVIDGAHRLVALCRAGAEEVDAYVAHMQ
jgi:ParB-like nuclease domain